MEVNRNIGFDLLRILAALMVVVVHVASPQAVHNMKMLNAPFWAGNLFDGISRFCVPIFVIVSGHFVLKPVASITLFYRKRLSRILYPFLIWSAVYILWTLWFDGTAMVKYWKMLYWGKPYFHLWFIAMLLGLYFLSPMLADLRLRIGARRFFYASLVALLVGMAIEQWNAYTGSKLSFFLQWTPYVGYFMLGATLDELKRFEKHRAVLVLVVLVCAFSIVFATGMLFKHGVYSWYFYSYLSLPVILGSVALVLLFRPFTARAVGWVTPLAELTFGIYLIHVIPLGLFNRYYHGFIGGNPFIHIPLVSLGVFMVSVAAIYILRQIGWARRFAL